MLILGPLEAVEVSYFPLLVSFSLGGGGLVGRTVAVGFAGSEAATGLPFIDRVRELATTTRGGIPLLPSLSVI